MKFIQPIKDASISVLKFFNLLDRGNKLSITNVAVVVILVKMAIAPFDWVTAAGLFATLINYGHKRMESNKSAKDDAKVSETKELTAQVQDLKDQVKGFQGTYDQVQKTAEEAKRLISSANLSNAYVPRRDRPQKD